MKKLVLNKDILIRKDPEEKGEYLLMNVVSGDIFRADVAIIHGIKKLRQLNINLTKELIENHIILERGKSLEYPSERIKFNEKDKFHIQWHITNRCNLRCKHCYHEEYESEGENINSMKKIVDDCFGAISKWGKIPEVSLTGGEPLMNNNLLPLIKYIHSYDSRIQVTILTNGTLIDQKFVNKIKNKNIHIQVSLEGDTKEINDPIRGIGTYEKILNVIDILKKK